MSSLRRFYVEFVSMLCRVCVDVLSSLCRAYVEFVLISCRVCVGFVSTLCVGNDL